MLTLGLAFIIVCFFLSIWRPWIAVVILIVLQLLGAVVPGIEDVRGLSFIAIGGLLGSTRYFLRGELKGWAIVWPMAFIVLFIINLLISGKMDWGFAYLLAGAIGTYYLTIYAIRSPRHIFIIAFVAILVGVICSMVSIAEFRVGAMQVQGSEAVQAAKIHAEKKALLGNPNYFFPVIMPGLFFSLLLWCKRTSVLIRIGILAGIALMTMGVVATLSRGSIVSLFSIFIIFAILSKRRSNFRGQITVLALGGMMLGLYYFYPDSFLLSMERFQQSESMDAPGSRGNIMRVGIEEFLNSPIWGGGLGAIHASAGQTPHDGYTALLGDMGLMGFFLFYAMPYSLLTYLSQARRRYRRAINQGDFLQTLNVFYAFMVGMLILNIFNPIIYSKPAFLLIAFTQLFVLGLKGKKTEGIQALLTFLHPSIPMWFYPNISKGANLRPWRVRFGLKPILGPPKNQGL